MKTQIKVTVFDRIDYDKALELQQQERESVINSTSNGAIFVLEHEPCVITLGRRGQSDNLLLNKHELDALGVQIRHSSRGGDVTVHEPGQVVVYVIARIRPKQVHSFVVAVMKQIRAYCNQQFNINCRYDPARPGLWAGDFKFCSVGFDLTGNVSMHGVSINVANDLRGFNYINPCGMDNNMISSLTLLTGEKIDVAEFKSGLAEYFKNDHGFLRKLQLDVP